MDKDYRLNVEFRQGNNAVLMQDPFLTNGQKPSSEWAPGEMLKQTASVYTPTDNPIDMRLWLYTWSTGQPLQILEPKDFRRQNAIILRLEP